MLLLILIALLAGAGTALSPCVLPILPAVAAAGVTGGRRRPAGIALGLGISFALATLTLVYLIDALGLPNDTQRFIAIAVLAGFGIAILVPAIGDRVEAQISRWVGAPRMRKGEGFGSGMLLGAGLGLVYLPCAGPILAGIITLSASQTLTLSRILLVFAYALGTSLVLYALLVGGRKLVDRFKPARGRIQAATGVVMIAAALLLTFNLDRDYTQAIATGLPDFVTNPTTGLEESDAVRSQIADVNGFSGHEPIAPESAQAAEPPPKANPKPGVMSNLPVLNTQTVPDLTNPGQFFNTPGGAPASIKQLNAEGKTVLIDFWTYTCINCLRTLPHVEAWYQRYSDAGLVVIGVHTPEFPFERDAGNVAAAVRSNELTYPVVQDNDYGTWNAFGNQYWPAKYLIDPNGNVRYVHFGEGDYTQTEDAIRSVLAESQGNLGTRAGEVKAEVATKDVRLTAETYLGAARAQGWVSGQIKAGSRDYGAPPKTLPSGGFAYSGNWDVTKEEATAGSGAGIDAAFSAKRVFLVLGSPGSERDVQVLLDGKPIPASEAGSDVKDGVAQISDQRLYSLVDLPKAGQHRLSLRFDAGVAGYAFTFG